MCEGKADLTWSHGHWVFNHWRDYCMPLKRDLSKLTTSRCARPSARSSEDCERSWKESIRPSTLNGTMQTTEWPEKASPEAKKNAAVDVYGECSWDSEWNIMLLSLYYAVTSLYFSMLLLLLLFGQSIYPAFRFSQETRTNARMTLQQTWKDTIESRVDERKLLFFDVDLLDIKIPLTASICGEIDHLTQYMMKNNHTVKEKKNVIYMVWLLQLRPSIYTLVRNQYEKRFVGE